MIASPASTKSNSRGRLAVVSGLAHNSMTPRGQRTQNLVEELGKRWDVELVALPPETFAGRDEAVARQPLSRRALGSAMRSVLLDRWEPWSARRLFRWHPDVDAALLIGYPWSPVTRAARKLAHLGIPYVVDAGDPWVLTEEGPFPRNIAIWRSRRAELPIWRSAAGVVVTTPQQGDRLKRLFPQLRILARPNGFVPLAAPAVPPQGLEHDPTSLRLAHFGTLSRARVDIVPLLAELQRSGRWRAINLVQFGNDYEGMLQRVPEGVRVERRPTQPWPEIVAQAGDFDAAVVLGNQRGYLLPSKAVQYLTLPIPRLAVTGGEPDDALAVFAEAHRGWIVTSAVEPEASERLWGHLKRDWSAQELAPPDAESWPTVAVQVAAFVESCISGEDPEAAHEPASVAGRSG
ncbi:MAG TPA: glycosyltransferase [Solirubrobacterales bacterium]